MSKKSIFVGVPIYEAFKPDSRESLLKLLAAVDLSPDFEISEVRELYGESLISRARNNLASQFLKTKSDNLFFFDSDIMSPESSALLKLARINPQIAGAVYVFKNPPYYPALRLWGGKVSEVPKEYDFRSIDKIIAARYVSGGFMIIDRRVLEAVQRRGEYPFMPCVNREGEYLSEDWSFCERANDIYETPCYVDPRITLYHIGIFGFGLGEFYTQLDKGIIKKEMSK